MRVYMCKQYTEPYPWMMRASWQPFRKAVRQSKINHMTFAGTLRPKNIKRHKYSHRLHGSRRTG
jgi:hypothetical protein